MQGNTAENTEEDTDSCQGIAFPVDVAVHFAVIEAEYFDRGDLFDTFRHIDIGQIVQYNKGKPCSTDNDKDNNRINGIEHIQYLLYVIGCKGQAGNMIIVKKHSGNLIPHSLAVIRHFAEGSVVNRCFLKACFIGSSTHIDIVADIMLTDTGYGKGGFFLVLILQCDTVACLNAQCFCQLFRYDDAVLLQWRGLAGNSFMQIHKASK